MSQDLNLSTGSHALDEETARAEVYGLLAALYYAPPSAELLAQLSEEICSVCITWSAPPFRTTAPAPRARALVVVIRPPLMVVPPL